jgi:hypothetical protein
MSSVVEYFVRDGEYYISTSDGEIYCGNTIGFLFDKDTGTLLAHGELKLVRERMIGMIKLLTLASVEMPKDQLPEEIFKEVCDMKEALTLLEIECDDGIDLELINNFINNTGFLKTWYEKEYA